MKKLVALLAVLTVVLAGCGEANISKADSSTSAKSSAQASPAAAKETESASPKAEETNKLGDSVNFDDLVVTVAGVRESKSQLMKPKEGNKILLVDITAENKGNKEINVSSMLQTKMADDQGYQYNLTIVDDQKGNFDGAVAAGRKLRGEVAFEVPKDAASLEFIFSDPFESGQAIWKVK
ncbi:DUF4352 domain-containing protein [Cohnella pontilimi]|uniref:DUF4352 domain-containing protein n=1 Tax=Cohnella pontilimi TaxID=2564100 RepID=UPI00145E9449|nr:DUF4352 domain-containing protein [Cohnella pontilimi]